MPTYACTTLILFKTQILFLKYLAKDYATTGHFPLYLVILLKFTETSSNLAATQIAKTTLRPLSSVLPSQAFWILKDTPLMKINQNGKPPSGRS